MNYFKRQSDLVLSANAGFKGNRAWRPIVDSGQLCYAGNAGFKGNRAWRPIVDSGQLCYAGNAGPKGKKRGCRAHKFNSATCRDSSHQFMPFFQHAAAAGDPEPNACRDQARRRALRKPCRPVGGGTACSTSAAAALRPAPLRYAGSPAGSPPDPTAAAPRGRRGAPLVTPGAQPAQLGKALRRTSPGHIRCGLLDHQASWRSGRSRRLCRSRLARRSRMLGETGLDLV